MAKTSAAKPKPKRERSTVAVCFQPDEVIAFQGCADKEARPLSNFIRLAALRGLAEYKRDSRALIDFKPS